MKPEDPGFDAAIVTSRRDHVANFTMGYQTPQFDNWVSARRASDWRVVGDPTARSGMWLSVTQSINRDTAGTGIQGLSGQPVNKFGRPVRGQSIKNYLNPAAFVSPSWVTLGDAGSSAVEGPGFWTIDMGVVADPAGRASRTLEFRVEAFNLSITSTGATITTLDTANVWPIQSGRATTDPAVWSEVWGLDRPRQSVRSTLDRRGGGSRSVTRFEKGHDMTVGCKPRVVVPRCRARCLLRLVSVAGQAAQEPTPWRKMSSRTYRSSRASRRTNSWTRWECSRRHSLGLHGCHVDEILTKREAVRCGDPAQQRARQRL